MIDEHGATIDANQHSPHADLMLGRGLLGASASADADLALKRLQLDNEDLRFECVRLKTFLDQTQAEVLRLSERNRVLQHREDRLLRHVPAWVARLARAVVQPMMRR